MYKTKKSGHQFPLLHTRTILLAPVFALSITLAACGSSNNPDEIIPGQLAQAEPSQNTSSQTAPNQNAPNQAEPAENQTPASSQNAATAAAASPTNGTVAVDPQCAGEFRPEQITDLVLATGQSNLIGADTSVAATLDQFGKVIEFAEPDTPHPRVFAWTVDPFNDNAGLGWAVANLTQSWHDTSPGSGGIARNNLAFHFAKQVAKESSGCRVVGIVMVAEGGTGIAHWDEGATGWNEVVRQVGAALSAIGKTSIDGVLWHQGESDWIVDGSCFPDGFCTNGLADFYPQRLYSRIANPLIPNPVGDQALIDRLRRQSWFGDNRPFIAAETLRAPVNVHLVKLNTDDDFWTATVRGDAASGLEINPNDPFENHYSAEGLRQLGGRYATEYMKMKGLGG